jgi:hypothetical protein
LESRAPDEAERDWEGAEDGEDGGGIGRLHFWCLRAEPLALRDTTRRQMSQRVSESAVRALKSG